MAVYGGPSRRPWASHKEGQNTEKIDSVDTILIHSANIHLESKKQDTKLLAITSPTIIRFSNFFSLADSVVNLQQIHV